MPVLSQQQQPSDFRYWYRAQVVSVYDADTFYLHIDQGLGLWNRGVDGRGLAIRLYGIDAWELRGPEREKGLLARDFLVSLLTDDTGSLPTDKGRIIVGGTEVIVNTIADDDGKYGRLLAKVYIEREGVWLDVAQELVAAGHAEPAEY